MLSLSHGHDFYLFFSAGQKIGLVLWYGLKRSYNFIKQNKLENKTHLYHKNTRPKAEMNVQQMLNQSIQFSRCVIFKKNFIYFYLYITFLGLKMFYSYRFAIRGLSVNVFFPDGI